MKSSRKENAVDPELAKLYSSVEEMKRNKEIGVKYMRMREVMEQVKRESLEEGIGIGEERGKERGIKIGEERGEKRGEERYSKLTAILLKEKKYSELERASVDEKYRKELYWKYQIESGEI